MLKDDENVEGLGFFVWITEDVSVEEILSLK
jgi:hypothetical protein